MRIKAIAAAILLAGVLLLGGCQTVGDWTAPSTIEDKQNITGGQDLGGDVNVKDITMVSDGQSTVITLYFIKGSRKSDVGETKLNAVPSFRASLLPFPQRLRVTFAADYWDYEASDDWYRDSLVGGSFRSANSGEDTLSIYFQLTGAVAASFEETGNRLLITLTPKEKSAEESYFVGLNAFEEWGQNLIPEDLDLTPTLCADLSNIILISKPFSTQESAQNFADRVRDAIVSVAAAKNPYVFALESGSLPEYNATVDLQEVNRKLILEVDGQGKTLPVLVENGRYLCTAPDGSILYARSYFPDSEGDSPDTQVERIWMIGGDETKTELDLPNFSYVETAAFSSDGKYLAILDTSMLTKILYVFDTQTGDLKNLGEEGFGDVTSSFVWDRERNIIYAMTGHGDMRLMRYDFGAPAGSRISFMEELPGAESAVATDGVSLYFADPSAGTFGEIYAIDIVSGTRTLVAQGISFKLSPDGNTLASLAPSSSGVPDLFDLWVTNLSSGEAALVMDAIFVEDYAFGMDSDNLYFTTSTYEGIPAGYHNAFLRFSVANGSTELIGYSTTEMIRRGSAKNEMYLIDFFDAQTETFYVTYIYTHP
jgi:WD40 repeat protein